jgi:hypothetical protein
MNVFSFQKNTLSIEHMEGVEEYWNMVAWSKCYGVQDVAHLIISSYHNPFTKLSACHYYVKIKGKSSELQEGGTQGLSDIWRLETTNETHMKLMLKNPLFPCSYIKGFLTSY